MQLSLMSKSRRLDNRRMKRELRLVLRIQLWRGVRAAEGQPLTGALCYQLNSWSRLYLLGSKCFC